MSRVATPANEEYLLYIAENGTASHVEGLVPAYRRGSRGEDLEMARRHREERYLDMCTDDDGMVVIRGRLPQRDWGKMCSIRSIGLRSLDMSTTSDAATNGTGLLAPTSYRITYALCYRTHRT
jgi:hypothetical protein